MLPFLKKPVQSTGLVVEVRKPDKEEESGDMAMESVAKDLLDAIETKDHKKMAMAIRNAFQIFEMEPHEEADHEDEEEQE